MGNYADNVTQILLEQGRQQSQARLASGQAWSQAAQQLGQIPGQVLAQQSQLKDQEQRRELQQQQIAKSKADEADRLQKIEIAKRADADKTLLNGLYASAIVKDPETGISTFKRDVVEAGVAKNPRLHLPDIMKDLDDFDARAKAHAAERRGLNAQALYNITKAGNTRESALSNIAVLKANDAIPDQQYQALLSQVAQDPSPEGIKALVERVGGAIPEYGKLVDAETKRQSDLAHVNAETTHLTSQARKADADAALVLSGGKPEHSPAFKEWQDYQSQGGKLDFNAYQTEDANRKRPVTNINAGGTAAGLDADGLELAATAYRLTKALPARNAQQNGAIITRAAKQAKALGNSPVATIQKQAAYKGDSAALNKMQSMSAAAEAFETKANAQVALVSDLSKKVGRTDWPIVNDLLLSGKAATGDTDTHLFSNALLTFSNEYAKIMEGSTGSSAGSSESARRDAAKLISTGLNNGTIQKTLTQMQWEMRQTILGYDTVIGHINERMGGSAPAQTNTVVPPPGGAPQQKPIPGVAGGIAESTDGGQTWHRVK